MENPVLNLGTAIKIQTVVEEENPDSVTIVITDPSNTVKINAVAMTKVSSKVYQYVWQSSDDNDIEGEYQVRITATYGVYKALEEAFFTLKDIID